jgi:RHS repeat-associated protein
MAAAQPTTQVVEYYTTDAIGSVRAVTKQVNGQWQVVTRHDFMPFGEEVSPQVPPHDKRLFTGKERDHETGLDYFGARYYRANLGRFSTVDPELNVKDALVDPHRWNRYAYARDNPLRWVDHDGRDIWLADGVSKRDARFIRKALVEYVRRPDGRAKFDKLAGDNAHTVVLKTGSLNDAEQLKAAQSAQKPIAVTFGSTDRAVASRR